MSTNRGTITNRSTNRGAITSKSTNKGTITSRSTNRGTITSWSTNKGTITSRSTNKETITSRSTKRGNITSRSTNRGTITSGSTNLKELLGIFNVDYILGCDWTMKHGKSTAIFIILQVTKQVQMERLRKNISRKIIIFLIKHINLKFYY